MATYAFSRTDDTITINDYSNDNPGSYAYFVDTVNDKLIVLAMDGSLRLEIQTVVDTITINASPFSGTAAELKTELKENIFYYSTSPAAGVPYLSYVALMNQNDVDDPIAIVLENTLGFTPIWTRVQEGKYHFVCTFELGKVVGFVSPTNPGNATLDLSYVDQEVLLQTWGYPFDIPVGVDELMTNLSIEIRVYP